MATVNTSSHTPLSATTLPSSSHTTPIPDGSNVNESTTTGDTAAVLSTTVTSPTAATATTAVSSNVGTKSVSPQHQPSSTPSTTENGTAATVVDEDDEPSGNDVHSVANSDEELEQLIDSMSIDDFDFSRAVRLDPVSASRLSKMKQMSLHTRALSSTDAKSAHASPLPSPSINGGLRHLHDAATTGDSGTPIATPSSTTSADHTYLRVRLAQEESDRASLEDEVRRLHGSINEWKAKYENASRSLQQFKDDPVIQALISQQQHPSSEQSSATDIEAVLANSGNGSNNSENIRALVSEVRRLRTELREARSFKPGELSILRQQHQRDIEERLMILRSDHQMELKTQATKHQSELNETLKYKLLWAHVSSANEDLEIRVKTLEDERNHALEQLAAAQHLIAGANERVAIAQQQANDEVERQKHLSAVVRVLTERLRTNGLSLSVQLPSPMPSSATSSFTTATPLASPAAGGVARTPVNNGALTPRSPSILLSPTSPATNAAATALRSVISPGAVTPPPPIPTPASVGGRGHSIVTSSSATPLLPPSAHAGNNNTSGGMGAAPPRHVRSMSSLPKDPKERVVVLRRWQIDRRRERANVREQALAKEENDPHHYRKRVRGVTPITGVNDHGRLSVVTAAAAATSAAATAAAGNHTIVTTTTTTVAAAAVVTPVRTAVPPQQHQPIVTPSSSSTVNSPVQYVQLHQPAPPPSGSSSSRQSAPSTPATAAVAAASPSPAAINNPVAVSTPSSATPTHSLPLVGISSSTPRIVIPATVGTQGLPPTASSVSTPTSAGSGSASHSRANSFASPTPSGAATSSSGAGVPAHPAPQQLMMSAAERANRSNTVRTH